MRIHRLIAGLALAAAVPAFAQTAAPAAPVAAEPPKHTCTKPGDFPVCEYVSSRTIALPFYSQMNKRDVARVCETLETILESTIRGSDRGNESETTPRRR